MRYYKWGVSRLLLESSVQPAMVPMFITGLSDVMHESRKFPRFLPRVGKKVTLHIGDAVPESTFSDLRHAWYDLKGKNDAGDGKWLKENGEIIKLRIEATRRVREEVVKLRRRVGFPEEEDSAEKVETYRSGHKLASGTWEKDM